MKIAFPLLLSLSLSAAACTSETIYRIQPSDAGPGASDTSDAQAGRKDGGADPPAEATKDGIKLAISGVEAALEISSTYASACSELVVIGMQVTNVSSPTPVSVAYALFSLATADALVKTPELEASEALVAACPQATTIEQGGSLECAIVFDVKQNMAKELRYKTPSGGTLAVSVPAVTRCHDVPQLGTEVPVTVGSPISPGYQGTVPTGTFVLDEAVAATAGAMRAQTMRIGATTMESTLTREDGVVIQRTLTYAADPDDDFGFGLKLTPTCISPFVPVEAQNVRVGVETGSGKLLVFYDNGSLLTRWRKVN